MKTTKNIFLGIAALLIVNMLFLASVPVAALGEVLDTARYSYVAAPALNFDGTCAEGLAPTQCGIVAYLVLFINILSGIVGIVAVVMLTVWGIQYTVSRDNPQMVATARLRILQTLSAVVMYIFMYIFLQWLVPGGVL